MWMNMENQFTASDTLLQIYCCFLQQDLMFILTWMICICVCSLSSTTVLGVWGLLIKTYCSIVFSLMISSKFSCLLSLPHRIWKEDWLPSSGTFVSPVCFCIIGVYTWQLMLSFELTECRDEGRPLSCSNWSSALQSFLSVSSAQHCSVVSPTGSCFTAALPPPTRTHTFHHTYTHTHFSLTEKVQ